MSLAARYHHRSHFKIYLWQNKLVTKKIINNRNNSWLLIALVLFVIQLAIAYILAKNGIQSKVSDILCVQCTSFGALSIILTSTLLIPLSFLIGYILSYKTQVGIIFFSRLGKKKFITTIVFGIIVYFISLAGFVYSIMSIGF